MSQYPRYPDLVGKVALVFGAGQAVPASQSTTASKSSDTWGNGAAITWMLAHNGCHILGCDISVEAAAYTASRIRASHPSVKIDVEKANVTVRDDIERVVKACMARYGRIDILINNVGNTASGDPASLAESVWDAQINLNLKSVYLALKIVLPIMEEQGSGVVVNNASIAGLRYLGKPQVAYNAAKAGVIHLTKTTACIYAEKGVRLNCVAPGLMFVPLIENMATSKDLTERETFRKITEHNVPMRKMGTAWDVASATTFLASDSAAGYITGQTLVVDGGLTSSTGTGFTSKL